MAAARPILILLLLTASGGLAAEAGPAPGPAAPATEAGKKPKAGAEPVSSGMNAARLLPLGVPCKGVRMPDFKDDLLVSRIRAREIKRINDDQLQVTAMEMERYGPDGNLDHVVTIESGFYEMASGKLTSQYPTRVRGRAFDIQGQGCDYAQGAPVIRILGNVVSYFYPDRAETKPVESKPGESAPPPPPAAP